MLAGDKLTGTVQENSADEAHRDDSNHVRSKSPHMCRIHASSDTHVDVRFHAFAWLAAGLAGLAAGLAGWLGLAGAAIALSPVARLTMRVDRTGPVRSVGFACAYIAHSSMRVIVFFLDASRLTQRTRKALTPYRSKRFPLAPRVQRVP